MPRATHNIVGILFLFATLTMGGSVKAAAAYWVWERTQPLTAPEITELRAANVTQLYWQAGTLTTNGAKWIWRERFPLDWKALNPGGSDTAIIPVLRLEPAPGAGLPETSFSELIKIVNDLVAESGGKEMQIDYECPDRLVPNYVDFLQHLKEAGRPGRLSISALGHWSKFAGQFQGLADEITPMFYDLNTARESLSAGALPPLFNAATAASQIAAWKDCPLPWRAGLPNFSRLTLVDQKGASRGNIRRWNWDEIWFSPLLQATSAIALGETCFAVKSSGEVGRTPMESGDVLVARYPDRAALQSALVAVKEAGAEGVIYFRLAGEDDMSGFSPQDLSQTAPSRAAFQIKNDESTRITLTNISLTDLMPQMSGTNPARRGYCLVLRAKAPIWRDVLPGDFALVTASTGSGPSASLGGTTLRFWFTHLAAGKSLATGLVERAPGTESAQVTWRIDNVEEENVWHELKPRSE